MQTELPQKLINLARGCGFPLYAVGGFCRDAIAGLNGKRDVDLCAPVTAERFCSEAERFGYNIKAVYKNTGTVKFGGEGEDYEFACFRTDTYVRGHAPAEVSLTDDIFADARRRDFKCNAVYYDISRGQFVDPLGGIEEIKRGTVTCANEPYKVFGEDGLRLMRLCRQCAETGFTPTEKTIKAARENAEKILEISPERISAELEAILVADLRYGISGGQYRGLKLLHQIGVLKLIIPELCLGDGMAQRADFHKYDVLEHSLKCVYYAEPRVRLAALLHDIGKPRCKIDTGAFSGHELVGEEICREVCVRLKISRAKTERAARLVRLHMYDLDGKTREAKVRRLIVFNYDIFDDLLALKQADYSACRDDTSPAPCVVRWKKIHADMLREGVPLKIKQLKVRGDELIALGVKPKNTGKVLNALLAECAAGGLKNQKEKLVKRAFALEEELK